MRGATGKRVAITQPLFFPYAGYFRLLEVVDEFIIFDCVQFPRRGRVHRTEVPGPNGAIEWLTLPLARQPRATRIVDLEFADDARTRLDERLARLRWFWSADTDAAVRLRSHLSSELRDAPAFLEASLRLTMELLGLDVAITRSSELDLDPDLRRQDRIIEVALARGAREYVNAPGGRALYDGRAFAERGLELLFLAPYEGPYRRMLHDLVTAGPMAIAADMRRTALLEAA